MPNVGGTELPMYYYAKELVKKGHEVTIFAANAIKFKPSNLRENEVMDGILVRRFRFFSLPFYDQFFFSPSLLPALLSIKTDVVHIFSWLPSFYVLLPFLFAKLRKTPLVLYPQCYPERCKNYPSATKRLVGTFMDRILGPRVFKRASFIIALTKREADFYKKCGVNNVEIVREPIFLTAPPPKDEISRFSEKHGICDDDVVLLSVGRIVKYKGIDTLIKSLPILLKYNPRTKLLVVGEDSGFLSQCIKLVGQLNCKRNVIFTGLISDEELSCAYEVANVVIVPSFFEGYGRVVLEAWVHQRPVIVTESVGLAELVSSDGGIVVKTGDSDQLAYAALKLINDPKLAERMGKKGFQKLRKEFTWKVGAESLERIYYSLSARSEKTRRTG